MPTKGRQAAQAKYNSKPEQKRRRASRGRARTKLGLKVGDPRHVDHKDGNAMNNSRVNLRIRPARSNVRDNKRSKKK